jgi:acyl-CoA synthetase (NDP forming)/RimJ/RimL family protein N-acetyltransferase
VNVAERWTSTVVLGDGTSALIRPITPDDAEALAAFHLRQSPESRYLRYFSPKPELTAQELERFTTVDFVDRAAFVMEEHGEFVAWASYERWNNRDDAEVAFMVDDHHHAKGIATLLLEHLAAVARSNGIQRFTAQTLGDNRGMLSVFAKAGWPVQRRFDSGVVDIDFPLADTASFIDSVERREQRADSRAMARVLLATSIAVIGASDSPGTIGAALWERIAADERRRVYPVNPNRSTVGGVETFASVTDVPDEIGLAVIAVPAAALVATIEQCIDKRVRGAVVVTVVDDAPELDIAALVARARRSGLRIIGPGSMGIASPREDVALQAALADVRLPPGNVAISLQSGTLGSAVLFLAAHLRLPMSWFVSLGQKSDVSGNDLLQFWEDDEATRVIAIYSESLGNPRKYARIARRVSLSRPIVSVRTGSALADEGTDALYAHTGVIVVPTVTALLDTARTLSTQPLMGGRRVAVVSNSPSPTMLAAASLERAGLEVVPPPRQLNWRSSSDDYRDAMRAAVGGDAIDAVMVIHAPPLAAAVGEPTAAIEEACAGATKPVVAVMLGAGNGPLQHGSGIPSFRFPEQAAAVLGRIADYSDWRRAEQPHGAEPELLPDVDADAAAGSIGAHLDGGQTPSTPEMIGELLATYGVTMSPARLVDASDAVAVARQLGYPVAIKAQQRHPGRTAGAGVALDLADDQDVESTVAVMQQHLGADAASVVVQRMVPPGIDIRVRVRDEERVGPVVTVGLGGFQADAIGDEASRLAPVSVQTAAALIADTRAASALDADACMRLAELVARVSQLAADHPQVAELDINPAIVNHEGCWVVDATLTLAEHDRVGRTPRRLEDR